MKAIHKEYNRAFILEETKLTRLVEVVHGCLANPGSVTKDRFEVFAGRDRVEEATTLDEVFETENSRKNPVHRLVLTCSAPAPSPGHGDHEIQVDFASAAKETFATPAATTLGIIVSVRSDVPGWSSRTLSAVEEQVDRTRFDDIGHRGALAAFAILLLILLVGLLATYLPFRLSTDSTIGRTMWLTEADIQKLSAAVDANETLTDEQVRELITMQLRNLADYLGVTVGNRPPAPVPASNRSKWEVVLLFGPLVVLMATALFLVRCYPNALFLWGDAIGRYENLKQTRSFLWSVLIGTAIVGVLTNAFKAGLLSHFV